MARIKFTGPSRPNDAASSHGSRSTTPAPAQKAKPEKASGRKKEKMKAIQEQPDDEETQFSKQWQSLDLVMIMVHVAFGAILYLREFLPLHCFSDRDSNTFHPKNKLTYKNFVYGEQNNAAYHKPEKTSKRGQPFKVLARGSHPTADGLANLLETGIFDALKQKFLAGIQLSIFADKNRPENVLEIHTFTFEYSGGHGDCDKTLTGISLDSPGFNVAADMDTAKKARHGIEVMIRRLILLNAFLPELPSQRYLGVHLFYTDDCPTDYEPAGFGAANDEYIYFPIDQEWRRESIMLGSADSGYHTFGIRVTNLKWLGSLYDEEDGPMPPIPPDIEYKDRISRASELGIPENIEDFERMLSEQVNGLGAFRESFVRQDAVEKQRLQEMAHAESWTQDPDGVPTQPLNGGQPPVLRYELSETRIREIQEHLSRKGAQPTDGDSNHVGSVQCQCGWNGEEAQMLECAFCHTRQHMLCYGFIDPNDPNMPNIHACYRCLLEPEPTEKRALQDLTSIVKMRRALNIIVEDGYPTKAADFAQKLHCTARDVTQITSLLKSHKYIQATPGSKSKGFTAKGLPPYLIPQTEEMKQRLRSEVWDPLTKIVHYYTFPVKGYYSKNPNEPDSPVRFFPEPMVASSSKHVEPAPKATPAHTVEEICKETPRDPWNDHPWYVHNPYADPEPPKKEQPKQKLRLRMRSALNGNNKNTTTTNTNNNGTNNSNNNNEMDWESTASSDDELSNVNVMKGLQRIRKRGFSSVDESNNPSQRSQANNATNNQRIADRPIKRIRMSKIRSPIDIGRASTTDEDSSDSSESSE